MRGIAERATRAAANLVAVGLVALRGRGRRDGSTEQNSGSVRDSQDDHALRLLTEAKREHGERCRRLILDGGDRDEIDRALLDIAAIDEELVVP